MKTLVLALLIFGAFTVQAQQKQSLKDLLYSGKLKKDSSGVIRSTDDLSAKIDTTTKRAPEPELAKPVAATTTVASTSPASNAAKQEQKTAIRTDAAVPINQAPAATTVSAANATANTASKDAAAS